MHKDQGRLLWTVDFYLSLEEGLEETFIGHLPGAKDAASLWVFRRPNKGVVSV